MHSTRKPDDSKPNGELRQHFIDLCKGLSADFASTNDTMRRSFLMPLTIAAGEWGILRGSKRADG